MVPKFGVLFRRSTGPELYAAKSDALDLVLDTPRARRARASRAARSTQSCQAA